MGKFIRKSKIHSRGGESMEISPSPSPSSSLGVLTRAKSLALQRRLHQPSSSPPPSKRNQKQTTTTDCSGGGYLQLRSRRLQKKSPIVVIRSNKRRKVRRSRNETCGLNPNPNPQKLDSSLACSIRESSVDGSMPDSSSVCGKVKEIEKSPCVETSFGENFFELHGSESLNRTTRESTPCSLIRQPEMITSPGSSTKLNNGASDNSNQGEESLSGSSRRRHHLPSTPEMNEFFSGAEEEQQKQFIEKYNFDPVNEQPLPGRYEWKKVDD